MTNNSKPCTCSICGVAANSIPGKPHRRCGGSEGAKLRPKPSPCKLVEGSKPLQYVGTRHQNAGMCE